MNETDTMRLKLKHYEEIIDIQFALIKDLQDSYDRWLKGVTTIVVKEVSG